MKVLRRFWRYLGSDGGSVPYGVLGVMVAAVGIVFAVLADGAVGVRAGYALELLWVLGLVAVWQRVRPRLLLTSGIGWLAAMVVSTTATPAERGVPLGLAVGAGIALVLSLSTRSGVTFEMNPGKVYHRDDSPKPKMETAVVVATAGLLVAGVVLLVTAGG
ncbi:hypothetical protein E1263_37040 [Kribbella antibiotica]|uniref:Uncharacterized protein n=1 Tax=Kribbella antibiotica TaxID=190195 RepID=A0A4R4YNU3_9ACTN|nr:hypothetical protein [Kribbella antibiotica]TDD46220.1 hypothetical protein E1263_37040 [Kribbella antibiotica]